MVRQISKRVYNRIIIDIETGKVLEKDSYLYDGPFLELKGGTTVQAPQPTQEERNLQQAQADLLKQQNTLLQSQINQQNLLAPILFENLGLTPTKDDKGNVTGYTQDPNNPIAQIKQLSQQRELLALQGKLPVDSNITQGLDRQEQTLRAQLQQQYGPGYEGSTGAIQTLGDFFRNKSMIVDAASRGDLTTAATLQQNTFSQLIGGTTGISNFNYSAASTIPSLSSGYSSAIVPYEQQLNRELQASEFNAQNRGTDFSLGGMLGGGIMGGIMGSGNPLAILAGAGMGGVGMGGALPFMSKPFSSLFGG